MSKWKGFFVPHQVLFKHRDHCGEIRNHIEILAIEYEVFDRDERTQDTAVYITMRWDGSSETYLYEDEAEGVGSVTEADAIEIVVNQTAPQ